MQRADDDRAIGAASSEPSRPHAVPRPRPAEAAPRECRLSIREREVAELVLAGKTYRQVGGRLFISTKTVEHHVARIRHRLGAGDRSDLLARLRTELGRER